MNLFELLAIVNPLVGAITGGLCVKTTGADQTLLGGAVGLVIGLGVYFGAGFTVASMMRVVRGSTKAEDIGPLERLASFGGIIIFVASPLAVSVITSVIVTRALRL